MPEIGNRFLAVYQMLLAAFQADIEIPGTTLLLGGGVLSAIGLVLLLLSLLLFRVTGRRLNKKLEKEYGPKYH